MKKGLLIFLGVILLVSSFGAFAAETETIAEENIDGCNPLAGIENAHYFCLKIVLHKIYSLSKK